MKKILKVVLVLLALGSVAYWGYRYSNATTSLIGRIHVDAEKLIKIGVHDIRETLVLDALGSPSFYYEHVGGGSKKNDSSEDEPDKGIDLMPYNLVLFSMKNVEQTLFTMLPIDDYNAFETYITTYLEEQSVVVKKSVDETYSFTTLEKTKMTLAWNNENIVIAFSPKIDTKASAIIFKDLLVDQKVINDKSHPIIEALKQSSDHITYIKDKDRVTLNFKDKAIEIEGELFSNEASSFPKEVSLEMLPKASLQLYWDYSFYNEDHKKDFVTVMEGFSFFEKNNIEVQAIADRTNGFFSLAIQGRTSQTDTVITYTYDDNFEKQEQRTVATKEVPGIRLDLGSGEESLKAYLTARGAVTDQALFKALPYYQFYIKEGSLNTSLGTFKGQLPSQKQLKSNFMDCSINFEQLQKDLNIPQTEKTFGLLEKFTLGARQTTGKTIVVKGKLTGFKKDINIISQLFFGLNKK